MWLFGYGSLVWRPGFEYVSSSPGYIKGWCRRFWQGSTDHRENPGRVVTLLQRDENGKTGDELTTWGIAYEIAEDKVDQVLEYLDFREKGGYTKSSALFHPTTGDNAQPFLVNVYIASEDNKNFLGYAPPEEIAKQIAVSVGPSGHNVEYLNKLAEAIRSHGVVDEHVEELAQMVKDLEG